MAPIKVASSGGVGLVLVLDGVGRDRDSFVLSRRWQGGAFTNLPRIKRREVLKSDLRELGSFS